MSQFRVLPPGLAQRLIRGIENELAPLAASRMAVIKEKPCPRCQSPLHPFLNAKHAFSSDDPLPRQHGRCTECGLVWDPKTDLILEVGDPSRVRSPVPIVGQDPDY